MESGRAFIFLNRINVSFGYHLVWLMVLSEAADFGYECTDDYDLTDEGCLMWNDPIVAIEWPEGIEPILSSKDKVG